MLGALFYAIRGAQEDAPDNYPNFATKLPAIRRRMHDVQHYCTAQVQSSSIAAVPARQICYKSCRYETMISYCEAISSPVPLLRKACR
jgi:hypothetical protein